MTAFFTPLSNWIDLASSQSDGNVPVDGSTLSLDGVNITNNMRVLTQFNTSAAERAIWDTGADHTQPWTKIKQINTFDPSVALILKVKLGDTYGVAASGGIAIIPDVSTGLILNGGSSSTKFGSAANGGYQDSVGIFKYVTQTGIDIPAWNSEIVTFTFFTGSGAIPFTDIAAMSFVGSPCVTFAGSVELVAVPRAITDVASVEVEVFNMGGFDATGVSVNIDVKQV